MRGGGSTFRRHHDCHIVISITVINNIIVVSVESSSIKIMIHQWIIPSHSSNPGYLLEVVELAGGLGHLLQTTIRLCQLTLQQLHSVQQFYRCGRWWW